MLNRQPGLLLIAMLLLAGCGSSHDATLEESVEVVDMTPLPEISSSKYAEDEKMEVLFRINRDGSVDDLRIVNPTAKPAWNEAATDSLKKWRFAPLPSDAPSEKYVIRRLIEFDFFEGPTELMIGEIRTGDKEEADSLYGLLKNGMNFLDLQDKFREEGREEFVHEPRIIDILRYPEHVRSELNSLSPNRFTEPLRLGDQYVIFKRYYKDYAHNQE